MKKKKDIKFGLTSILKKQEQTKPEYKYFKMEIENNGCCLVKTKTETVKIYSPELMVIFTTNELTARNMETQTETTVNGRNYLNSYIEAYKEGEQYFENEFKVSPNTLYGEKAEQYVKGIHLNYFHINHSGTFEGWGDVKKSYPFILTHEIIKKFGYYSGIVNKVEEQVKKHPLLFATFDKCEHNLPPQPINNETDTEKYTAKHYLLAYLFERNAKGESLPRGNKRELERIGNERMGAGKGNRFYKVFNEVINKDLNAEKNLFEIGGEYWRKAVIELSKAPELVEKYLQSKQI
jgi:hypothetical protein